MIKLVLINAQGTDGSDPARMIYYWLIDGEEVALPGDESPLAHLQKKRFKRSNILKKRIEPFKRKESIWTTQFL